MSMVLLECNYFSHEKSDELITIHFYPTTNNSMNFSEGSSNG